MGLIDYLRTAYRTYFGGPAVNVIQPPVYRIFLRLRFVDPDGTIRNFPPDYPVRVRFGDGATAVRVNPSPPLSPPNGVIHLNARTTDPWQTLTLEFNHADIPYIVCEPLGSPPLSPPLFRLKSGLKGATAHNERFFSLPKQWELRQADWSPPPNFGGFGSWESPPGRIKHTNAPPNDIHIGTQAVPVDFILNPHWHFARWEFFDRYFGNANLDSPPRPAHQKRISIPQIEVEGFRSDVNANSSPPDTHSNWVVDLGNQDLLQAVPFILQRNPAGAALSPPDGTTMGLRFHNPHNTVVYSITDQQRVLKVSPPPAKLGPDRLRYYDMPEMWKSRRYYTRRAVSNPAAAGKFFHTLSAGEIAGAENRGTPLVFCLDDMVLCTGAPNTGAVSGVLSPPADTASSPPSGRVAIFNHRFDDKVGANSNPQGVYKMLSPPGPDQFDLPRSDVTATANYLHDYPDWTRVVVARGNVHDVFDKRTGEGMSPPGVVGARAAVRWLDSAARLPGVTTWTWGVPSPPPSPPNPQWNQQPDGLPLPGRMLWGTLPETHVPGANTEFAIAPYHQERTPTRYSATYAPAHDEEIGRYDMLLMRCCDVQEGREVAINLNYLKSGFDFSGPLSPPLAVTPQQYSQGLSQNVANRWSGNDPGINEFRTRLLPGGSPPPSPPPPLRVDVVWFPQSTQVNQAHCKVVIWNQDRDNRGTADGTGASGIDSDHAHSPPGFDYAAAHETGHMGGMPDEYNERWNSASYGQMSMQQNLPGDPYEPDGRDETGSNPGAAMMNGLETIRNRYFWHNAEWIRRLTGIPLKVVYQDIGGTLYDNFFLPHHTAVNHTHYCWPLTGHLDQTISPPPAQHPSPPVAYPQHWGRYDLFLYALGREEYSSNSINTHASVGAPFDAILVIAVKFTCALQPSVIMTSPPDEESQREQILQVIAGAARQRFNHTYGFSGQVNTPNWTINKGLIHLVPQFVVENFSPPWDAIASPPLAPVAQGIQNVFGINYQVRVEQFSPPSARWSPPGRRLVLDAPAWANLDPLFANEIPRLLGINKNLAALTPADLQRVVRLIVPGAVVRLLP